MHDLGVEPEYLELVTPDTFVPVRHIDGEPVLLAVAARVGAVRLIDNELLVTDRGGQKPTSTGSP
jgi:pantoate--beta-alanine ligase